jgi:hypothetical protein
MGPARKPPNAIKQAWPQDPQKAARIANGFGGRHPQNECRAGDPRT